MRPVDARLAGLCLVCASAPACSLLYDFDGYRFDRADVVDATSADSIADAPDAPDLPAMDAPPTDVPAMDAPAMDAPAMDAPDARDVADVADRDAAEVRDATDAPTLCDTIALCRGACVDLSTNPAHCGRCDQACPGASGLGLGSCAEGACECFPGATWDPARGRCELSPPRPVAPLSTSRVTTSRPRLSWVRSPRATGARVTLCRDRAMTLGCRSADGRDDVVLTTALSPGVWFWRLQSLSAAEPSPSTGPVWQLRVPHVAPTATEPAASAWGTSLDLNGDGRDDVAVSAVEAGNVFVYQSPVVASGAPTQALLGPGGRVASAGDVDGDGFPELIVERAGSVSLYRGGHGGVASSPFVFSSAASGDAFGYSLAAAGDVNADGYGDVIVGAPGTTNAAAGAAYVYLGGPAGLARTRFITVGAPDGGRFGTAVGAGDFNGDGVSDVVVSAPSIGVGSLTFGRVYVYYGPLSPGETPTPGATLEGLVPTGALNNGRFGARLAAGADVNGDGRADLAVDAPTYPVASGVGQVSIFLGSAAGLPSSRSSSIDAPHGGYFGDPVESAGDVDGDGYGDLVIAAHEAQALGGTGAVGRAYVFVGTASGMMFQVPLTDPNPRSEARFGFGVTGLGDINGDGFDDFAVGDPLDVPNRAHVYLGADDVPVAPAFTLTAPTSVDARQYGYWIALAPARRLHRGGWSPSPSFAR